MHADRPQETGGQSGGQSGVVVEGETPVRLPAARERVGAEYDLTTRTIRFQCSSGEWLADEWVGLPVQRLLSEAQVPSETTHVVAEAADGYRSCVEITALSDAMVAYDAVDRSATDFPRFVSSAVGGPRAVKNLARLVPVALDAEEDPEAYEDLQLDDD